ncbi:hypothetical protein lerEdw1_013477 [Lerista edwardsae]|nr:hypothetical protein lerEdw1_013479 [Lerista edwardsae]KAJ6650244.1 hypothetical protein lerEdw1_013477 [Lerista edwardsae]
MKCTIRLLDDSEISCHIQVQGEPSSSSTMDPEKAKELPKTVKKFYKGEPLALGITQILIGIIGILFGTALNVANFNSYYDMYWDVMIPHWTGILVKGMLGMNTVSAVAAGIAIIFLGVLLPHSRWHIYRCTRRGSSEIDPLCYENEVIPNNIVAGVMSIFLLLATLEFCISISTAAFGCKTVCLESYTETVRGMFGLWSYSGRGWCFGGGIPARSSGISGQRLAVQEEICPPHLPSREAGKAERHLTRQGKGSEVA